MLQTLKTWCLVSMQKFIHPSVCLPSLKRERTLDEVKIEHLIQLLQSKNATKRDITSILCYDKAAHLILFLLSEIS